VDADLDTLATALYVRTDDLLKDHPHRIPWRPRVGIATLISDAEMVTLSVMQDHPRSTPCRPLKTTENETPVTPSIGYSPVCPAATASLRGTEPRGGGYKRSTQQECSDPFDRFAEG
jgi:hypothetical protein